MEVFGEDRKDNPKTLRELINEKDLMTKLKVYEKPSDKEIKAKLTDLQYYVTQEEGTERPFNNEYWDNKEAGIYVDIVTGEPLFSSTDKYKSGTGYQALLDQSIQVTSLRRPTLNWFIHEQRFAASLEIRILVMFSKTDQNQQGYVTA